MSNQKAYTFPLTVFMDLYDQIRIAQGAHLEEEFDPDLQRDENGNPEFYKAEWIGIANDLNELVELINNFS